MIGEEEEKKDFEVSGPKVTTCAENRSGVSGEAAGAGPEPKPDARAAGAAELAVEPGLGGRTPARRFARGSRGLVG